MNKHTPPIYIFASVKCKPFWVLIKAYETENTNVDTHSSSLTIYGTIERSSHDIRTAAIPLNEFDKKPFYSPNISNEVLADLPYINRVILTGFMLIRSAWNFELYDTIEDVMIDHFSQLI